ncbi:MAG: GNAT family N-acetyltransferase [Acidimicrobiia bacterium]|jgi:acetyl coenzyme A synthetase (ADP forming)-like protein
MTGPLPDGVPDSYPAEGIFDVVLRDGSTIRIRPIRPDDGDGLQDMLGQMSRQSVYHRFFKVKDHLTPAEIETFTRLDYRDRMAFVAERGGAIVGVGRYHRIEDTPATAEIAFAVIDAQQGKGIARRLLQLLASYARDQGITAFQARVLADNHVMIRVFRNAGFTLRRELDEGVYTVQFPTGGSAATIAAEQEDEKRAVAASLMPIFYPSSVAVIGASRDPQSIGGRLFKNILNGDYTGPVFPVNPRAGVVRSVKTYRSILDIPEHVDLAFIVVPAPAVIPAVKECAEKGVKGLVIISAGFSETGPAGKAREQELLEVVRSAGMRMVGPNCMGVLNTDPAVRLDGQFGPHVPPPGNVAMSSQSGALGVAILDYAAQLNIGISSFVSVGNKPDVSGDDLLLYWEDDPSTDVILLYLESFGNPRRFARAARRIGKKKPIVAVKSGRSSAGARAAASHTGSLASLDVAVDSLFRQAGVVRTDTLESLFDVTALLANQPLPAGRRVGIVTNAGGPGILAADALSAQRLDVVEFTEALRDRLRIVLSPDAGVSNPVDMIASAGPPQYAACVEELFATDEVDAIVAIFIPASPLGAGETVAAIRDAALAHHGEKPFLLVYMSALGAHEPIGDAEHRIPTYPFPEQAAWALAKAVEFAEWQARDEGTIPALDGIDEGAARAVVERALSRIGEGPGWLEADEVAAVLAAFSLTMPHGEVVHDEDAAVAAAAAFDGPAVLKVVAESAVHKSDIGGVALDRRGEAQVREGYRTVRAAVADPEGVLVQEQVPGGHEVLIGMTEDPTFGPLVVFGLGGIYVELLNDVAFRLPPLTDVDAAEMIGEVKSAPLLRGYRGGDPGDLEALQDALLRVSALAEALPEVVEMDLNPVKVRRPGEGVTVVDARMRVRRVGGPWVPSRRDVPSEL